MNEDKFPVIKTERLILTLPNERFAPQMVAFVTENREHLSRWEPQHSESYFTEKFWREQLISSREEFLDGVSLKLVLFANGQIIGGCNFTNIVRKAFQACYLGYSIDYRFEGKGLMYESARAAIDYVFNEMKLHRIMANYIPTNERSGKLLQRLGFVIEGTARDYLLIDGRWQDHILTSLTNQKSVPSAVADG
jgi:ribosomal-protein-alanine N-acetyltransferase